MSEMFVDGFLELMKAGVLKREVDGYLLHAGFFLGPKSFYRALREMPAADLKRLHMTAISFINELYGDEENKRRARAKARFINGAMMATLLGGGGFRWSGRWPRRQRGRRAVQLRKPGLRAQGRPIYHYTEGDTIATWTDGIEHPLVIRP